MKDNKIALIKVLQYDKFNPGVLTIYDRMLIHNYRNQKKPISAKLKDKILIISEEIHLKIGRHQFIVIIKREVSKYLIAPQKLGNF
ncbi:hypothetical protein R8G64_13225 [Tenacibaculum maritimum]